MPTTKRTEARRHGGRCSAPHHATEFVNHRLGLGPALLLQLPVTCRLRSNGLFPLNEFLLCLSRACLGTMIGFYIKSKIVGDGFLSCPLPMLFQWNQSMTIIEIGSPRSTYSRATSSTCVWLRYRSLHWMKPVTCRNASFVECFPYVCPEPVLVK